VLPFDPDPRLLGAFFALVVTAAAVAMGVALRRLVAMYMPEDNPRASWWPRCCSTPARSSSSRRRSGCDDAEFVGYTVPRKTG
jgi:hypothetical protein